MASEENWKIVMEQSKEVFGKIDILVNNAGIHKETIMSKITLVEWNRLLEVNLTNGGTMAGSKIVE
ncbi:SDR family NAD(P)-dependent oxidoreductase [Niallia sp. Krafla_26]|uniref:SDR family NAD(P)-dependent oxidoreductase n=1 Tax=Niallia sp. Krafla_26 TaxID=3064703 RepID=UPI003D16C1E6